MIPVNQTTFGIKEGNCHAACVASILEIPIDQVPNFAKGNDSEAMHAAFGKWAWEHGQDVLEMYTGYLDGKPLYFCGYQPYVILSGKSPRCDDHHAVVGRISKSGFGFEVIHDPHPDKTGLPDGFDWITFIMKRTDL